MLGGFDHVISQITTFMPATPVPYDYLILFWRPGRWITISFGHTEWHALPGYERKWNATLIRSVRMLLSFVPLKSNRILQSARRTSAFIIVGGRTDGVIGPGAIKELAVV